VETIISPETVLNIGIEAINSDSVNSYYGIGGDFCTGDVHFCYGVFKPFSRIIGYYLKKDSVPKHMIKASS
jgi:hypothetical protein